MKYIITLSEGILEFENDNGTVISHADDYIRFSRWTPQYGINQYSFIRELADGTKLFGTIECKYNEVKTGKDRILYEEIKDIVMVM